METIPRDLMIGDVSAAELVLVLSFFASYVVVTLWKRLFPNVPVDPLWVNTTVSLGIGAGVYVMAGDGVVTLWRVLIAASVAVINGTTAAGTHRLGDFFRDKRAEAEREGPDSTKHWMEALENAGYPRGPEYRMGGQGAGRTAELKDNRTPHTSPPGRDTHGD